MAIAAATTPAGLANKVTGTTQRLETSMKLVRTVITRVQAVEKGLMDKADVSTMAGLAQQFNSKMNTLTPLAETRRVELDSIDTITAVQSSMLQLSFSLLVDGDASVLALTK